MFTPDAQCRTNAPDNFGILKSQRRRWINSTIHNLAELTNLGQLCGFCCISMRFVVILDLLSTVVAPASVVYVFYLIYTIIFERAIVPIISLVMIGAIYGLQAIIFMLKKKWEHIGWMIIYIIAMPIFSFFLPLYSFWNMDDFNWGDTRIVINEDGREVEKGETEDALEPNKIVTMKISDWKKQRDIEEEFNSPEPNDILRFNVQPQYQQPQQQQDVYPLPQMTTGFQYHQYPLPTYAPSHIANYVGNYYPPPSQYVPSNYVQSNYCPTEVSGDDAMTEASFRRNGEKRDKGDKRHRRKGRKSGRKEKMERLLDESDAVVLPQVQPILELDLGDNLNVELEDDKKVEVVEEDLSNWAENYMSTK